MGGKMFIIILFLPAYLLSGYGVFRGLIDKNIYSIASWGCLMIVISISVIGIEICNSINNIKNNKLRSDSHDND